MSGKPPLLPEETLHRVVRTARVDGWVVMIVATTAAVSAAGAGDPLSATLGLGICGAGAVELHGVQMLRGGDSRGMRWLISAQLILMIGILAYATWRGLHFDEQEARLKVEAAQSLREQWGLPENDYTVAEQVAALKAFNPAIGGLVGLVTVIFQGAMIRYYLHRYAAVETALGVRDDT